MSSITCGATDTTLQPCKPAGRSAICTRSLSASPLISPQGSSSRHSTHLSGCPQPCLVSVEQPSHHLTAAAQRQKLPPPPPGQWPQKAAEGTPDLWPCMCNDSPDAYRYQLMQGITACVATGHGMPSTQAQQLCRNNPFRSDPFTALPCYLSHQGSSPASPGQPGTARSPSPLLQCCPVVGIVPQGPAGAAGPTVCPIRDTCCLLGWQKSAHCLLARHGGTQAGGSVCRTRAQSPAHGTVPYKHANGFMTQSTRIVTLMLARILMHVKCLRGETVSQGKGWTCMRWPVTRGQPLFWHQIAQCAQYGTYRWAEACECQAVNSAMAS